LRADWHTDPFEFIEQNGYYYGRGTQDMKDSDAALVATFLRLHREGYKPHRDLILALTADEEGGKFNGAAWLVQQHRDLVDAAYVINPDSGGVELDHGRSVVADVEATEKVYSDFQITALNRGGHSSLPRPDNAIYELTTALNKLSAYSFPFELNEVTRTYFKNLAERETGQTASDMRAILATPPDPAAIARLSAEPSFNSNFRTTCVATRLSAGHANNALPQTAQANVNCRIFPGHSPEETRQQLIAVFADPALSVKYVSDAGIVADTAPERKAIAPPAPIQGSSSRSRASPSKSGPAHRSRRSWKTAPAILFTSLGRAFRPTATRPSPSNATTTVPTDRMNASPSSPIGNRSTSSTHSPKNSASEPARRPHGSSPPPALS